MGDCSALYGGYPASCDRNIQKSGRIRHAVFSTVPGRRVVSKTVWCGCENKIYGSLDIAQQLFMLLFSLSRVGVKYFSKYLSQVQVLFRICKYKFKYSEYLEDIKYIKYFFSQVQVKYKYFGNKALRAPPLIDYAINHRISYYLELF